MKEASGRHLPACAPLPPTVPEELSLFFASFYLTLGEGDHPTSHTAAVVSTSAWVFTQEGRRSYGREFSL